ncbi:MAG: hypothetical protein GY832_29540 [Chloroflexi bacterium]|nr:hypothetical protein [Chloroflexota bacterium]
MKENQDAFQAAEMDDYVIRSVRVEEWVRTVNKGRPLNLGLPIEERGDQ